MKWAKNALRQPCDLKPESLFHTPESHSGMNAFEAS
jgi:hypothetical protein